MKLFNLTCACVFVVCYIWWREEFGICYDLIDGGFKGVVREDKEDRYDLRDDKLQMNTLIFRRFQYCGGELVFIINPLFQCFQVLAVVHVIVIVVVAILRIILAITCVSSVLADCIRIDILDAVSLLIVIIFLTKNPLITIWAIHNIEIPWGCCLLIRECNSFGKDSLQMLHCSLIRGVSHDEKIL